MLLNGTVTGDIYSQIISLGAVVLDGAQLPYNSVAGDAYVGAQALYQTLSAMPCDGMIMCPTQTFTSGVYCYNGSLTLPHALNFTFDARGDPSAVFVLSLAGHVQGQGGQMNLINGALPCNIFVLVHGSLQPVHAATLFGIWLVAGNIDAVSDIALTGKLISVGPGTTILTGNSALPQGQGDINPAGQLRISSCACYAAPTPAPAPVDLVYIPPIVVAGMAVALLIAVLLLLRYWPLPRYQPQPLGRPLSRGLSSMFSRRHAKWQ